MDIKVIVNTANGAHYDCDSLEEAREVFYRAPATESGDRILTVDGVVVLCEYVEAE